MRSLFIDCPTGLAGNMILAGFLDLGIPIDVIKKPISLVFGRDIESQIKISRSYGIKGLKIAFHNLEKRDHTSWQQLKALINSSSLPDHLQNNVFRVFHALAQAEASVHGENIDKIHFHEVGSPEALAEVIGVCASIEYMKPNKIYCAPPPCGSGNVTTTHGLLPVPVPVVVEIANKYQINLIGGESFPKTELTTPTGLALMAVLADSFCQPSKFNVNSVGMGLGDKELGRPNFLRVFDLLESDAQFDSENLDSIYYEDMFLQEAWVDDSTPEDISFLISQLKSAGAIEVICHPVQMKKGRQGINLQALVKAENAQKVRLAWFYNGSTLGLRENIHRRWSIARRKGFCITSFGKIKCKQIRRPDGVITVKPEHEELSRLSIEKVKSIEEIRIEVLRSSGEFIQEEDWLW